MKIKALTKTEPAVYQDPGLDKHTSCWYNSFSKHLVGNYENWVFAQVVKDWCVGSYKTIFDTLKTLGGLNLLKDVKEGLSNEWGAVYYWPHVDLKEPEKKTSRVASANTGGNVSGVFKGLGLILENVCSNFEKFPCGCSWEIR